MKIMNLLNFILKSLNNANFYQKSFEFKQSDS